MAPPLQSWSMDPPMVPVGIAKEVAQITESGVHALMSKAMPTWILAGPVDRMARVLLLVLARALPAMRAQPLGIPRARLI